MAVLPSVFVRAHLIMSLAELGRFAEAAKYEEEATRFADSSEHLFTISWAHFAASMLQLVKGEWGKAAARAEQWIVMLRAGTVAIQLPWALSCSALALAQIGEASEALNRVREGRQLLDDQTARGIGAHRGWAYAAVGRASLLLGRLDEARGLAERAVESARRYPGFLAHALHLLGDIATHSDRLDAEGGAAHYREALALARRQAMRPLAAHCHLGLGALYHQIGEMEHACENLAIATTMYREMDMRFWLEPAKRI
jgi:tetratricopeptide (TPR) repeat protein